MKTGQSVVAVKVGGGAKPVDRDGEPRPEGI